MLGHLMAEMNDSNIIGLAEVSGVHDTAKDAIFHTISVSGNDIIYRIDIVEGLTTEQKNAIKTKLENAKTALAVYNGKTDAEIDALELIDSYSELSTTEEKISFLENYLKLK